MINVGIKYDENNKRTNMGDWIKAMKSEGRNISNTGTSHISYIEVVRTGIRNKKLISTHPK